MAEETRADIANAVTRMTNKLGAGREIKRLPEHLGEGEAVRWLAAGTYGGGQGLLALTDRRLFFLKDGMMKKVSEDFPLAKISSIQWSSGMMSGKIQVFLSGNKSEMTNVPKAEGKAIVDDIRGTIASGAGASVAGSSPAPSDVDPIEQIQKFAALRDSGLLTDEEFAAKKAILLGI